jgi:hypothetical protein
LDDSRSAWHGAPPTGPRKEKQDPMDTSQGTGAAEPLTAPTLVIDDFMPLEFANAMRAEVEAHFANPAQHRAEVHQVWNYWFVPGLYTYLKTQPEKVIQRDKIEQFLIALQRWSIDRLGLAGVTWPFLSLYVNGCSQGLHNDSKNGRLGFVYSLTPIERRTMGGETIVLREGDLFRRNLRSANAGTGLYDLIEPRFNRLVLFDDRMVHGVSRVSGSMDPMDARCVLHGHIEETGPIIVGALPKEAIRQGISGALERFATGRTAVIPHYHGPFALRFTISPEGKVGQIRILLDRVFHEQDGHGGWDPIRASLVECLLAATFPAAPGETAVTLPMAFGGPVRGPRE